ncbi:MAG: S41 family peptidase, partial [Pirellula sp.]|nr:S41 family peptidase [Pirellula sp.]
GSWNIYQTKITREEEDRFAYSTLLTEEAVLAGPEETFQPLVSPDGKKLLYLENRIELKLLDLDTKETRTLVPGKKNFSYSDGDIAYDWSPDSKWVSCTYHGHKRWIEEIGLIHVATGEITNVSNSGYAEGSPHFSPDGSALLYVSDRYGMRSHGSWGSEQDVFAFYLNQAAYDKFTLNKEDFERLHKKKKKKDEDKSDSDKETDKQLPVEPVQVDLKDRELRIKRLTLFSSPVSSYDISPDGETLIFLSRIENKTELWVTKVREKTSYRVASFEKEGGAIEFSKDGKSAFLLQGGTLAKVDMKEAISPGGKATSKPIPFAAEMQIDLPRERAYMFEHAWRQTLQKFYDPKLHGVDWSATKQAYEEFLPVVTNNHDFADLLGEMLGELNASHTGGRYRPRGSAGETTAALGLLYDVKHEGVGLKVAEVIKQGPVDKAASKIHAGALILAIDGVRLEPNIDPWRQLNQKVGKNVRLSLLNPDNNQEWEEVIKPISVGDESGLLYERWIAKRRELCEKLSGGRIGYVHVQGMNDPSFRRVYSEVLGENSEKEALIVDTRFNGGGWLHDHLVTFLSGKDYVYFVPREKERGDLGAEPFAKWTRPVAVLQSESNYSDAHFFPWAFKELGLGKLIGAPVPGTATAVWWETMIDPSMVFGIPQVGMVDRAGRYLENMQLEPDVLVINDPESMARGEDKQLAKAVEVLLESLPKQP